MALPKMSDAQRCELRSGALRSAFALNLVCRRPAPTRQGPSLWQTGEASTIRPKVGVQFIRGIQLNEAAVRPSWPKLSEVDQ
jgi:hypothetical protein